MWYQNEMLGCEAPERLIWGVRKMASLLPVKLLNRSVSMYLLRPEWSLAGPENVNV